MQRETCRGNVTAAAEGPGDCGNIGVVLRAKAASDAILVLAQHAGDVDAGDGAQSVDDRLGIRFHGAETREIREIVDSGIASGEISGWQKFRNARKFAKYGRQYGWERIPPF